MKLDKSILDKAEKLATLRNRKEIIYGSKTYAQKHSAKNAHKIGLIAELVVANFFYTDINEFIYNDRGDDGVDLTLPPPYKRTQVKATTYKIDPWLRVEVESISPDIDSYILVYVNKNCSEADIVGWATKQEVVSSQKKEQLVIGGPVDYVLTSDKLKPVAKSFPLLVSEELNRARLSHSGMNSAHEGLAVIWEEFEELKVEVFRKKASNEKILLELVQLAAMCQRMSEDCKLNNTKEKV